MRMCIGAPRGEPLRPRVVGCYLSAVDVKDFDYALPPELIAQTPLAERDASRLLVLPRRGGAPAHRQIADLPSLLEPGDLLIANDARVIPARLHGHKRGSGGKVELLLVEPLAEGSLSWLAMAGSSKPLRAGAVVEVAGERFEVLEARGGGEVVVRPSLSGQALQDFLERAGELPLPPYIERDAPEAYDRDRYQTVFARTPGAVAAPTAGLHFTPRLLAALAGRGVELAHLTLHVGPGTFLPVRVERTEDHRMHRERYQVPEATAEAHARCRERGGRAIAVGTTSLRTLEAAWDPATSRLRPGPGATNLFITPGYELRAVDGLLTNFHLPKSTLFMLVSAVAGLERVLAAYREAIAQRYRFFSYGVAMLVLL